MVFVDEELRCRVTIAATTTRGSSAARPLLCDGGDHGDMEGAGADERLELRDGQMDGQRGGATDDRVMNRGAYLLSLLQLEARRRHLPWGA